MPHPDDVEAAQQLAGFVSHRAKLLRKLADVMELISCLKRNDTEWAWTEEQEKAFQDVKKLVTDAHVLSYHNPNGELEIQCDASQKGLGVTLLPQGKPVMYICCALTKTEQRYAQIEKRCWLSWIPSSSRINECLEDMLRSRLIINLWSFLRKPFASAARRLQGMMT